MEGIVFELGFKNMVKIEFGKMVEYFGWRNEDELRYGSREIWRVKGKLGNNLDWV